MKLQQQDSHRRQHPLARAGEVVLFWIPVLVPLVLLAQLGTLGLKPALENARAIAADERELDERQLVSDQQHQHLLDSIEAQHCLIYRGRSERRLHARTLAARSATEPGPTPAAKR